MRFSHEDKEWRALMDSIHEAMDEATREGIKANTIIINENMVKIKPFMIPHGQFAPAARFMSPMICGMNVFFTAKELPDGYSFAVTEGCNVPGYDLCAAVDYIYEKTYIDRDVIRRILELNKDYMEDDRE